jgi:hypothetical protein
VNKPRIDISRHPVIPLPTTYPLEIHNAARWASDSGFGPRKLAPPPFRYFVPAEDPNNELPTVFLSSPYRATPSNTVESNVEYARHFARFLLHNDCLVVAPHLMYPGALDDDYDLDRSIAMRACSVLAARADVIVCAVGRGFSDGMVREVFEAAVLRKFQGKPTFVGLLTDSGEWHNDFTPLTEAVARRYGR